LQRAAPFTRPPAELSALDDRELPSREQPRRGAYVGVPCRKGKASTERRRDHRNTRLVDPSYVSPATPTASGRTGREYGSEEESDAGQGRGLHLDLALQPTSQPTEHDRDQQPDCRSMKKLRLVRLARRRHQRMNLPYQESKSGRQETDNLTLAIFIITNNKVVTSSQFSVDKIVQCDRTIDDVCL
jgi:hypothetical protein